MSQGRRWWGVGILVGLCWACLACQEGQEPLSISSPQVPGEQIPSNQDTLPIADTVPELPEPPEEPFPSAFYWALREGESVPHWTTFRFRVPVALAGERLRLVFRAGNGQMVIHQATVARAEAVGALASHSVRLAFKGSPSVRVDAQGVVRSDPVEFPVEFREELAVSFEAEGSLAAGQEEYFPHSFWGKGSSSSSPLHFGEPRARLAGLSAIEVEGASGRSVVAIGDALLGTGTSGMDYRDSWPAAAERLLGVPVLYADASGPGLEAALQMLDAQVLSKATDCVVQPFTQGLGTRPLQEVTDSLSRLFSRLSRSCRVYTGTLPPLTGASANATGAQAARRALNDWLRRTSPASQLIDLDAILRDAGSPDRLSAEVSEDGLSLSARGQARVGHEVARRLGGEPTPEPPGELKLSVTYSDNRHEVLAVDQEGTVYAVRHESGRTTLWASTDNARTWKVRGLHPKGSSFQKMTPLKDGTLLADVLSASGHALARSTDHGVTWQDVLPLGRFRMLQPHSIRELRQTVFFLEYQTFALTSPIRLWVSTDKGATWRVRYTFQGRRHGHSLVADPEQGVLWAMMGDLYGGLLRSVDDGATWKPVLDGPMGVAVDGIVTPRGLLFGSDNLYQPPLPGVRLVSRDDEMTEVHGLPGPSYSILRLRSGGYVLGTTREIDGDVYPDGDVSAHLFYSADGRTWKEFQAFPRQSPTEYAHVTAYWELPSGEVVLGVTNIAGFGRGFFLLRATRE
jgi:photosystem II stability/assembly factor-like uncharacterized protein